jgi:cellobiose-specific phosphotransferase system component IIA
VDVSKKYSYQHSGRAKALAESGLKMLAAYDYALAASLLRRASDECKTADKIRKDGAKEATDD